MTANTISPRELAGLAEGGRKIDLIDVRTPVEYREVHLEAARNVPLDALDPAANAANAPVISTTAGPVAVRVIPTDEELMIARTVFRVVETSRSAPAS